MNLQQAKKYIEYLHQSELMFHFEDGAVDCLYGNGVCTLAQARAIDERIDAIYEAGLDWGEFECPIGYALHLMDQEELAQ